MDATARQRQGRRTLRPPRPLGGTVPLDPQHGRRLERHHLHDRGGQRQAGAALRLQGHGAGSGRRARPVRRQPPAPDSARRAASSTAGGAVLGEPANGGCGSYSIPSWMPWATVSPASRAARRKAISMPAETPAAVMILPSTTTRSLTGVAPNFASRSSTAQCVVARRPSSKPAAPRTSAPVHTDVVHRVVAWAARSQSSTRVLAITGLMSIPPGTRTISATGTSASAWVATMLMPASVRLGPGSGDVHRRDAPGRNTSTWAGPTASSAVIPSNARIAIRTAPRPTGPVAGNRAPGPQADDGVL